MGYSSEFTGELKFINEPTAKQLAKIKSFLGEDCREHPEWGDTELTYIDLELLDDFTGLKWDGSEKTYDLVEKVNLLIKNVKKDFPDFGLTGTMSVQGEETTDRWVLSIENGKATEKKTVIKGKKIMCPNCEEEFFLEEVEDKNQTDSPVFVFTGFRDAGIKQELEDAGFEVADNVTKTTTHLVVKDRSKVSTKMQKAKDLGCVIWNITELQEFINRQ